MKALYTSLPDFVIEKLIIQSIIRSQVYDQNVSFCVVFYFDFRFEFVNI